MLCIRLYVPCNVMHVQYVLMADMLLFDLVGLILLKDLMVTMKLYKKLHRDKHTQKTYPHDFAPLLYILPHGVDNVTAHVLSCPALLTHPHQTHPDRGHETK